MHNNRKSAIAAVEKRYNTGEPCKNGHVSDRLASNGSCIECCRIKQNKRYHSDIESSRAVGRARQSSDEFKRKRRAYKESKNPEVAERKSIKDKDKELARLSLERGLKFYRSLIPCRNCGLSERSTSSSRYCVECNKARSYDAKRKSDPGVDARIAERTRKKEEITASMNEKRAAIHETRDARNFAISNGLTTFITSVPCKICGGVEKYASSSSCVRCAKERPSKRKEYYKEYLTKNRDRILERVIAYNKEHREERSKKAMEWAKSNKDKRRAISSTYKAKRRQIESGGTATSKSVAEWLSRQVMKCEYCGIDCSTEYHIDHFIPLAKGGKHDIDNLRIACPSCNVRKNAKMPDVFIGEIERHTIDISQLAIK